MSLPDQTLKSSIFNEYLGIGKDGWLLYNNLSGAMIEIPYKTYQAILKNEVSSLKKSNILRNLKTGMFIVDQGKDEIGQLYKKKQYINERAIVIGLQILPTLGCNFRCSYCYEDTQDDTKLISQKVMDAILEYLKVTLKETTRSLNVSWYGGEPLLGIEQIEYLANAINAMRQNKNIEYFSLPPMVSYSLKRQLTD